MANKSNIYVTSEFIRDSRCSDYTLWIFGGGFNCPSSYTDPTCFVRFDQSWKIAQNQVCYWLNTQGPNSSGTTYGAALYGLTTCLNEDMTKATVKIYLNPSIYNTNFGYLTYSKCGFGPESNPENECIAFYFDRSAYIVNPYDTSQGGQETGLNQRYNDAAYITLDLSALNIAANIKPVYTEIDGEQVGGGFIYDHQHTLKVPENNKIDTNLVYADAGCMSAIYQEASKNRSVIVERTNRNDDTLTVCNYFIAADGRITDNLNASDYEYCKSYTCIGEPTTYGINSQKSMVCCLSYNDVIYFADEP